MAENKAQIVVDGDIMPLKQKLREAGDDLRRFGATGGPAVDGIASSVMKLTARFTALGALLSLGGLATMARQSIDAADRLNDLALRTQTSVKALASFKLIAEQSGTDLDALGRGLNKLSIWMAENGAAAKKLGIDARDPAQAFIQLAAAFERIETPQERARIANKILGKSFQDLIPLLMEGSKNLRDAAAASEEYAQKLAKLAPRADTFNDRLAEMKVRWDALKISMGSGFLDLLPNSMTMDAASARIIKLKGDIGSLQRALGNSSGAGLVHRLMYGTKDEITAKLAAMRSELAALQAQKAAPKPGSSSVKPLTFEDFEPPKAAKQAEQKQAKKDKPPKEFDEEDFRQDQMRDANSEAEKELDALRRAAEKELEIRRKVVQQTLQIKLLQADGLRSAEMARIDELAANSQYEVELGQTTQAQHLANMAAFNQQRLAAEQTFIDQKKELALQDPDQNPVEMERIELEKQEIRRRYAAEGMDIQRQQSLESQGIWQELTDVISGLWDKGIQALMNGTLTWSNAMRAIGADITQWFVTNVVGKMVKEFLAGEAAKFAGKMGWVALEKALMAASTTATIATKGTETTAVAGMNAVQAGTGAAASQASIPWIGPILAIAAMGAIFAAVSAMGKKRSAAGGFDIPKGLNPMTQLHEQEMVLPAHLANPFRKMVAAGGGEGGEGSGGQPLVVNISATDARGVRDLLMNNQQALVEALKSAQRNFER